jgi:hypothetical protein
MSLVEALSAKAKKGAMTSSDELEFKWMDELGRRRSCLRSD